MSTRSPTHLLLLAAAATALSAAVDASPVAATEVDAGHGDGLGAVPAQPADTVTGLTERARSAAAEGRHGEAAELYRAAAARGAGVAHWLRLSALQHAGRAGDTAAARRDAEALRADDVIPRDSVRVEEVRAAFEAGDGASGRERAAELDGDEDPDLWVRHVGPALLAAGDSARARRGYLAAATATGAPAEAGRRVTRLGAGWEELAAVARADLREGREARGRSLLERTLDTAPPDAAPGLAVRLVEARLEAGLEARAHRTARTWLDRGGLDGDTRARLELLAARSHLRRGQRAHGETHLRRAMEVGGGDRSARAAYLLADLAHDEGDRRAARARYREAADRFPRARLGGQARMRLGLMEMTDDRPARAAESFAAYRRNHRQGAWGHASLYWEGRARIGAGDSARGRRLLRRAAERDPVSYYGQVAAGRLDADPLAALLDGAEEAVPVARGEPDPDAEPAAAPPGARPSWEYEDGPVGGREPPRGAGPAEVVEGLLRRMETLRRLGWERRALRELDVGREDALAAAGGPLALAHRLHEAEWPGQGIGLAWAAFDRRGGTWSRPLLEAVYPLPHREVLTEAAAQHGVSPALVAAVIRQESAFDPRAVSPAGAVGLMQLMPGTAAQLARDGRRAAPDREALTNPELSLTLGVRYLANMLERFDGSWPAALIAYNAGPHRYLRWRDYPEFGGDRDLMVERIPFGETRRYVKAVLRNVYLYRRLHGLSSPSGADAD